MTTKEPDRVPTRKKMKPQLVQKIDPAILTSALCRNFGGKPALLDSVLKEFAVSLKLDASLKPQVKDLISSSLSDPHARHLMILTHRSSALSILFDLKILNRKDTTVLVGSAFRDDNQELLLIQQINAIKRAMARGDTVVLVNHDAIYEALYDVLNQRYLVRHNEKTGAIQRMLRLAVGTRSQLCPVGDGFKVVLIVEQEHALTHLDLPLLNRFEKQLLLHRDVLSSKQQERVRDLESWIRVVAKECKCESNLNRVFAGYNDGSMSSLVYAYPSLSLEQLKRIVVRISRPQSILLSKTLQLVANSYWKRHGHIGEALHDDDDDGDMKSGEIKLHVVMSASPASHLGIALKAFENCSPSSTSSFSSMITNSNSSVLSLAELNSERDLRQRVHKFLFCTDSRPSVMIVQCDPIICDSTLIEHSRYIVNAETDARSAWPMLSAPDELQMRLTNSRFVPIFPRLVVFVIHLPPALARRQRKFPLTFSRKWKYTYIDDVVPIDMLEKSEEELRLSTVEMVKGSVTNMVQKGRIPVGRILQNYFRRVLIRIRVPEPADIVSLRRSSFAWRLGMLNVLLGSDKSTFFSYADKIVRDIVISIGDSSNSHVMQALKRRQDQAVGSLRQSLESAVLELVLYAFALFLRRIDRNFNLNILFQSAHPKEAIRLDQDEIVGEKKEEVLEERKIDEHEEMSQQKELVTLWFELARHKAIVNWQTVSVAASTAVSQGNYANRDMSIENDGQSGVVLNRFPFSNKLLSIFNQPQGSIRRHVESVDEKMQITAMESLIAQNFGDKIANLSRVRHVVDRYLHDFVAICVPRYGISMDLQLKLYRVVLERAKEETSSLTVASVHVLVWRHEERLHCFSSLLSSLSKIRSGSSETILRKMANTKQSTNLAHLDMIILNALLESSPLRLKIPTHEHSIFNIMSSSLSKSWRDWTEHLEGARQWSRRVSELAHHAEALLSLTKHETDELRVEWMSIRLKQIAVDELLLSSLNKSYNLMVDMSELVNDILCPTSIRKHVYENKTDKKGMVKWFRSMIVITCRVVLKSVIASELERKTDSNDARSLQSMIAHFCRRVLLMILIQDRDHVFVFEDMYHLLTEIALGRFEIKGIVDESTLTKSMRRVLSMVETALLESTSLRRAALHLLDQKRGVLYEFVGKSAAQLSLDERSVMLIAEHFEDAEQPKKIEDLSACFNVNEDTLDDPKTILNIRDLGCARNLLYKASMSLGNWLMPSVTECPICTDEVGLEGGLAKLKECDHQFCYDCISDSFQYTVSKGYDVTCPMCRAATSISSIMKMKKSKTVSKPPPENEAAESLLSTKGDSILSGPNATSWGKWSSKIRWGGRLYMLRCLLRRQGEHALSKLIGTSSKRWEWLKDLPLTAGKTCEDQMGYLAYQSAFGKNYVEAAMSIKRALQKKDATEDMLKMFEKIPSKSLLASVFTQIYIRHTETENTKGLKIELDRVGNEIRKTYSKVTSSSPSASSKTTNDDDDDDKVNSSIFPSKHEEDTLFVSLALNFTNTWLKDSASAAKFFRLKPSQDAGGADVIGQLTVLQTAFHCAALALDQSSQSWMRVALFHPEDLRDVYLPSMPEDYSKALMAAVSQSSKVTKWWQCSCGERYAVGDCGRLNQAGRCTACGSIIGGQNKHGSSVPQGNKMVTNARAITLPGYVRLDGESEKSYIKSGGGRNMSPLTVLFFRFVLHSLLAVGAVSSKRGATSLSCLLSPDGKPRDISDACDFVTRKLQTDFRMLMDQLNLSVVETAVAVHLCLRYYASSKHSTSDMVSSLRSKRNRENYEFEVQMKCIQPVLLGRHTNNTVLKEIRRQKREDSSIRTDDEKLLWKQLREIEKAPSLQSRLWRYRQPVDKDHFMKWVTTRANAMMMKKEKSSERERRAMKLLASFIKVEEDLPHVKYLPCILRWHRLLFEYLSGGDREITYEKSLKMSNRDFLENVVPANRQQGARLIFDRFCEGFNSVFKNIKQIECHPNTYRDTLMGLDTALAISLPCAKRSEEGLSPGMCTVALLDFLQNLQNTILKHFGASTNTPATRIRSTTPSDLVRRSVIVYDQQNLTPLLDMFCIQSSAYGQGHDLDYDACRIADSLSFILAGKTSLQLEIREYHFRGEHLRSGHLESLSRHIVQQHIPRRLERIIMDELDTSQATVTFIQTLDECVAFLVSTSGRHATGLNPQELMGDFVTKKMLLPMEQWSQSSTRTIRREIRLCHLKHLRGILSKGMRRGDPFSSLSQKYRSVLDSKEIVEEVRTAKLAAASLKGRIVRARYKNSRGWYRGTIIRDRNDGTFDILYKDGDTWQKVPKRKIHLLIPVKNDDDGDDTHHKDRDEDGASSNSSKKKEKMKDIGEPVRFRVEVLIPVMRDFLLKVIENKISPKQNLKDVLGVMEVPSSGLRGAVDDPDEFYTFSEISWYNIYFPKSLRVEHCLTYLKICEGKLDLRKDEGNNTTSNAAVESTKEEE